MPKTYVIGGGRLSLPPAIMVAVGLAKTLGLPSKYAPHLSATLGMAGGIAAAATSGKPILWGVLAGVFLGAAACSIYDQGKKRVRE